MFENDAKRAGYMPKVIATSNGAYSDETWLQAQKKTNGAAGWLGRDPTAIDLVQERPSWKKVNEIYKKYSRGQNMGELAMREITGLLVDGRRHQPRQVGGSGRARRRRPTRPTWAPSSSSSTTRASASTERPERAWPPAS